MKKLLIIEYKDIHKIKLLKNLYIKKIKMFAGFVKDGVYKLNQFLFK